MAILSPEDLDAMAELRESLVRELFQDDPVVQEIAQKIRREADALRQAANRARVIEADEQRWKLVEEAISTLSLYSDISRLAAISSIVQSRKPLTENEIAAAKRLFPQHALTPERQETERP